MSSIDDFEKRERHLAFHDQLTGVVEGFLSGLPEAANQCLDQDESLRFAHAMGELASALIIFVEEVRGIVPVPEVLVEDSSNDEAPLSEPPMLQPPHEGLHIATSSEDCKVITLPLPRGQERP